MWKCEIYLLLSRECDHLSFCLGKNVRKVSHYLVTVTICHLSRKYNRQVYLDTVLLSLVYVKGQTSNPYSMHISNRKAQMKHNITLTPLMKFSFVTMEFAPLSNIRNKSKTRIPIMPIKRINSVKGSSRLSTRDRNHTVMLSIITLHFNVF